MTMNLKEKAKKYATVAHEGQRRKTTGTPMIEHPIRVAELLSQAGFNENAVAAAYLHDTVEDTYVTMQMIEDEFGKQVAEIVAGNTENKDLSWEERKQHTIESIATATLPIKALIVADKLDNLQSLRLAHQISGEKIWTNFKRGKEKQKWYFEGVAKNMKIGLENHQIPFYFDIYEAMVDEFFRNENN